MKDIAERLREFESVKDYWGDWEIAKEAADEIERLRKEVDELKDLMQATVNYTGASVSSESYTFHPEQEDE